MERPSSRRAFILAAVVLMGLEKFVPFGDYILYPLTLLATWVHEMGHGITSLLVGGSFSRLEIFADASGLAWTACAADWRHGLVSAGGLLAPPIVGMLTLSLVRGPRRARLFLFALSLALVVSLLLWVRTTAGFIAMPFVALLTGVVAWRSSPGTRLFAAQLLGLCLALDTVLRLDYVFMASVHIDGVDRPSDIAGVAQAFGGSYLVWGLLIAGSALAMVAAGLYFALRDRSYTAKT